MGTINKVQKVHPIQIYLSKKKAIIFFLGPLKLCKTWYHEKKIINLKAEIKKNKLIKPTPNFLLQPHECNL